MPGFKAAGRGQRVRGQRQGAQKRGAWMRSKHITHHDPTPG
jgi:hypothetical protein